MTVSKLIFILSSVAQLFARIRNRDIQLPRTAVGTWHGRLYSTKTSTARLLTSETGPWPLPFLFNTRSLSARRSSLTSISMYCWWSDTRVAGYWTSALRAPSGATCSDLLSSWPVLE